MTPLQETIDRLRLEVEELRASRKRLVAAADADRRRIERELHEGVQQHLVALAVNLQLVQQLAGSDTAAAKELLAKMARDVQQALEETAQLATRIYPPLLDAGGLAAALRAAAKSVGVHASVDVTAGAGSAPEVSAAVYLCCLEALEQVADGASATVTVREEEGAVVFEIAGSFKPLDRLRDRVEALGGSLTIGSERVTGSLPLAGWR